MKQVIQNFKSGALYVDDVPPPALSTGMVLVENSFSLISPGTERSTVKVAKASLLGKARQRPDLVAQVIQNIRKEGFKTTIEKVRTKLDTLKALGYSTSGKVIASMDTNQFFKPGDRVACAGQDYASHAELVTVPQNLVVKVPDTVSDEEASFTTLGAIALQGVRQADPRLGESVCVIGLGLLGQITCQLLKANGCRVAGIDMTQDLLNLASKSGIDIAVNRASGDLITQLNNFTRGHGFDAVIITAGTPSNDPVELAGEISRKKGKVIAVGAVGLNLPRDPHYYRKELDLRLSCSYGPGRYDVDYEENGHDYPLAYVRWTEQRNMQAFLDLVAAGKIDLRPLITHTFDITEAEKAYDIVMGKVRENHIGILLKYTSNEEKLKTLFVNANHPVKTVNIGFIGAGSFAQSYLLPNINKGNASLATVVTSRGITATNVAKKFGFNHSSSNSLDVLNDSTINTVFIATQHNTHAQFVTDCLIHKKNVFVEKPLAMTEDQLTKISKVYRESGGQILVGFNRRFSPLASELKSAFAEVKEPLVMNYRVNAGFIPKDHWTQQPEIGGGRIIGELCHFIDVMQFFSNSLPIEVYAQSIDLVNAGKLNYDNIVVTLRFENGSLGTITYVANGNKLMAKERFEVFGGGKVGCLNDYKSGEMFAGSKHLQLKASGKGHREEVDAFIQAIITGSEMPISFQSMYITTLATFRILDSLATGLPQKI